MKNIFSLSFLILIIFSLNAQLLPDYEFSVVFHSASGNTDTVYLGLSTNAIEGVSPGLDVIDTAAFNDVVDVKIYDEDAQDQLGGNCYNLKKFYQPYPDISNEFTGFEVTYIMVFKMDSFNNNHNDWSIYGNCEENNGFSYFKFNKDELLDFEFLNDAGLSFSSAQIKAYNFNLGNFDYYDIYSTRDDCFNVSFPSNFYQGICNDVDNGLVVSVKLGFINDFYLNEININSLNNSVNILSDKYEIYSNENDVIYLFDLNGNLVLSEPILAQNKIIINKKSLIKGVYILKFQNNSFIKKIISL